MTIKNLTALIIGGLFAFHITGGVLPSFTAAAAAVPDVRESFQPNEEFNHAIRLEHDRHEQRVDEIREAHRFDAGMEELDQELGQEREFHERNLREINERFHAHGAHLAQYPL